MLLASDTGLTSGISGLTALRELLPMASGLCQSLV
jgi:hypothetical protein